MHATAERVIKLARRRGAIVRVLSLAEFTAFASERSRGNGWSEATFTHHRIGIDLRAREVVVSDVATDDELCAGMLVHELGHLHAASVALPIANSIEWSWLGWEFAVAREAGARDSWDLAMHDYGMGDVAGYPELDGDEWGHLTRAAQLCVMRERIAAARRSGIVNAENRAIWRRLPRTRSRP